MATLFFQQPVTRLRQGYGGQEMTINDDFFGPVSAAYRYLSRCWGQGGGENGRLSDDFRTTPRRPNDDPRTTSGRPNDDPRTIQQRLSTPYPDGAKVQIRMKKIFPRTAKRSAAINA